MFLPVNIVETNMESRHTNFNLQSNCNRNRYLQATKSPEILAICNFDMHEREWLHHLSIHLVFLRKNWISVIKAI